MSSSLTQNPAESHNVINDFGKQKVVSFNMNGFAQEILLLKSLCFDRQVSLILIQEHWMTNDQLSNFDCFRNYYFI